MSFRELLFIIFLCLGFSFLFAYFEFLVDKRYKIAETILGDSTCLKYKEVVFSSSYYAEYYCDNNRVYKLDYDINDYASR